MKQFNLPRKRVALVQALVSLLLVVLTAVFSFTSILTIDISDSDMYKTVQDSLSNLKNQGIEGLDFVKLPEKLDINMPMLVRADIILVKTLDATLSQAKVALGSATQQDTERAEQKFKDLEEMMKDSKNQEAVITYAAVFGQVFDFGGEKETGSSSKSDSSEIGEVIMTMIKVVALSYICLFITIFPIVALIKAIIVLVKVLKNLKNPENVAGSVSGKMVGYLSTVVIFALATTLFNGMQFGVGLTAILVMTLVCVIVNVVASRMRSYNENDFKYVNIIQGTALLAGVGAILFFVNLMNSNVISLFFNSFGDYLEKMSLEVSAINTMMGHSAPFVPSFIYVVDVLVIFVFAVLALSITGALLVSVASHLGLTGAKKSYGFVSGGIVAIICAILPFVAGSLKNKISYSVDVTGSGVVVNEEVLGSIFDIEPAKGALVGMLIGAILILVAGIVAKVLKKKFVPGLSAEAVKLILNGQAPMVVATETCAFKEEAPVEEAPVEEAPVEEAPVEEAPVEEAPVEEAPVEEAPVEENTTGEDTQA